MKILIATNHSYMLYRFRKELIETLMKEHQVVLCMPFVGHEDDFAAMGLTCIPVEMDRRGMDPKKDISLIKQYRKIMNQVKPDMVITYSVKPNVYLGTICQMRKVPYLVNVQGLGTAFEKPLLSRVVVRMYRLALRRARVVFFENQDNAQFFQRCRVVTPEQIKVLPGAGINLDAYSYAPMKNDGICRFLYLGRIMQEKGIDEFFTAARAMKEKFGSKVEFHVVGFYEDSYKETVEQLVTENVIIFHGFQTQVLPCYQQASCVVMPSYHEGMSNVLLEGAAMGRGLITTNIPGCREAVVDGVTGFLCPVKCADGLQKAMERFYELDEQRQVEMGRQGRALMEKEFDKDLVVAQTVACIEKHRV